MNPDNIYAELRYKDNTDLFTNKKGTSSTYANVISSKTTSEDFSKARIYNFEAEKMADANYLPVNYVKNAIEEAKINYDVKEMRNMLYKAESKYISSGNEDIYSINFDLPEVSTDGILKLIQNADRSTNVTENKIEYRQAVLRSENKAESSETPSAEPKN